MSTTRTIVDGIRDELRCLASIYDLTLEELAEKAGVRADVYDCPTVNDLVALCAVFNVAVSQLVGHAESMRWSPTGEYIGD